MRGVHNVLRSVNKAGSVEKVVMTSSKAAVFGDAHPGHTYSEADWNLVAVKTGNAYAMAKTLAEWEAWAIAGQQERWKLVTLCPGMVYGPPVVRIDRGVSVEGVKSLVDGSNYPYVASVGNASVDVDDVCAAHVLAISAPAAHGRYLLAERGADTADMAAILRKEFPHHRVPFKAVPEWVACLILKLRGDKGTAQWIRAQYHKHPLDCNKAQRDLGLSFIPLEATLRDAVEKMMEQGTVPRMGPQPAGAAAKEGGEKTRQRRRWWKPRTTPQVAGGAAKQGE